jgi:hypothetical protein
VQLKIVYLARHTCTKPRQNHDNATAEIRHIFCIRLCYKPLFFVHLPMIHSPTKEFSSVIQEYHLDLPRHHSNAGNASADAGSRAVTNAAANADRAHQNTTAATMVQSTVITQQEWSLVSARDIDFQNATLDELLGFVLLKNPQPADHYALAAVLEMAGMRDVDARDWFGTNDIFALARKLYALYRQQSREQSDSRSHGHGHGQSDENDPASDNLLDEPTTLLHAVRQALPLYGRGLLSNVTWALQVACLAIFGYSFGVSMSFSRSEATAAGIGMALSMIATGGFAQTIGRLASFYLGQQNFRLTQQLYDRIVSLGLFVAVLCAVLLYGASWFVPSFPPQVAATSAGYFVLFSSMSLCLSLFYVMQHYRGLIGSTVAGLVVMVLVQEFVVVPLGWTAGIAAAHWCGIVATNMVALVWIRHYLRHEHAHKASAHQVQMLPRASVLGYGVAPYFVAGTLYFAFLFTDRFVNWTANAWLNGIAISAMRGSESVVMPVAIYPPYEFGLMWAFLAFTFTTPLLEYVVTRFMHVLVPLQQRTIGFDRHAYNARFVRLYVRFVALILIFGAVCAVWTFDAVMFAGQWSMQASAQASAGASAGANTGIASVLTPLFTSAFVPTEPVYIWAVVGYTLLALTLLNNLILFSLARPWLVVRGLCVGIVCNALLGWYLSHSVAVWMSVVGLAAGAFVLACVSGFYAVRTLKTVDFHFYAAF